MLISMGRQTIDWAPHILYSNYPNALLVAKEIVSEYTHGNELDSHQFAC